MMRLGPYAGLAWGFTVSCDSPALARQVERVFASLATSRPGPHGSYVLTSPSAAPGSLTLDGRLLLESDDEYELYAHLLWHLNQATIQTTTEQVLLHASAAEVGGRAVIMCAPSESGKTTLVAGLVLAGMRYLTDEAVAIDPVTRWITPFPKALAVDDGSWAVLPSLRPDVPPESAHLVGRQWQVPPSSIGTDCLSPGAMPGIIVLPRYTRGIRTRLVPVSPGETMVAMLQDTFELTRSPRRDMEVLAAVCAGARGYRLEVGSLTESVELVHNTLMQVLDAAPVTST